MVNLPVRGLGKAGAVLDVEPWDTPWEAWSNCSNVRFEDGKAMPAPIFRRGATLAGSNLQDAAAVVSAAPSSGFSQVYLVDSYGRASSVGPNGVLTDVSGEGYTPVLSPAQFTQTFLGDVLYLNREDQKPRYFGPNSTAFAPIPDEDTPNWTATVLRAFSSFLVAFNVTKAGIPNTTLVKWSDATQAGGPPTNWNPNIANTLAGETVLSQANGPILDANTLRNLMVIYTSRQIWTMTSTGDATFPFSFARTWEDPRWGAMGKNCAIEVDGLHYVFGSGDLYVHDGTSQPQSIADGLVRNYVFDNLNMTKSNACFVAHNPQLHEVLFAFPCLTGPFSGGTGCSRAAVWNYRSQTWALVELPNVTAWTIASVNNANTWAQDPPERTWANVGGTWANEIDSLKPALLMSGNTLGNILTSPGLYAVDPVFRGSRVQLPADTQANLPPFLEHGGIDLDLAQLPLQQCKLVRNIVPQVNLANGGAPTIRIGAAMNTMALPAYTSHQVYNPNKGYFVPGRAAGRYLAFRFEGALLADWDVTGFDLDVVGAGRR